MQLQMHQIQGAENGPHLLITGGVHGDEFEPMAAIRRLRVEIDARFALRGLLTLVPVVNEAAYLRGERTAEDELDLARTCPGNPSGSVTQRTAHALSELIRQADYYIDLHTGGKIMSVWPLVGYMLAPDQTVLDEQRRMARAFNLPVVWGTDYRLRGRSLSVACDAQVPAIYAEYLGSGLSDAMGVEAYVAGCLNVMAALNMIERQPPPSRIQHCVEDHRESAGYMQIRNPAPMTGFFEPHVVLGGPVAVGQPLGTISDVLGERVLTVPAQETGIVIVLRTFPRVRKGESLAVILETAGADSAGTGRGSGRS